MVVASQLVRSGMSSAMLEWDIAERTLSMQVSGDKEGVLQGFDGPDYNERGVDAVKVECSISGSFVRSFHHHWRPMQQMECLNFSRTHGWSAMIVMIQFHTGMQRGWASGTPKIRDQIRFLRFSHILPVTCPEEILIIGSIVSYFTYSTS